MTELETMQRAKMYLDKLSRGIDPITGNEVPEDTVLNNVRICRCLHYVSGRGHPSSSTAAAWAVSG